MNQDKDVKTANTEAETPIAEQGEVLPEVDIKDKTALEQIISEPVEAAKGKHKTTFQPLDKNDIKAGMVIRVHQKIIDTNSKGEEKERIQVFQGMVLARKHHREAGATILVRKVTEGIGVERTFPINLPAIVKFELVRQFRIKSARPYFLRSYKKKLEEIKLAK